MSTRAIIAVETENNDLKGVFHHWDGMPECLGKTLYRLFKDNKNPQETVDILLSNTWEHITYWNGNPLNIISGETEDLNFKNADRSEEDWNIKTFGNYAVYYSNQPRLYNRIRIGHDVGIQWVYVIALPYIKIYKKTDSLQFVSEVNVNDVEPNWKEWEY
jgi:hypothetical protein